MVNSLKRVYDAGSRGTPGYYCVERIETYGSFKPLMAMEFLVRAHSPVRDV